MNIAVIPPGDIFKNNGLFKIESTINRDNALYPYFYAKNKLKKKGINVDTYDMYSDYNDIDIILVYNLNYNISKLINILNINNSVRIIYYMTEPVVVNSIHNETIFNLDFIDLFLTWNDNYINYYNTKKIIIPNPSRQYRNEVEFENKKEICIINSNKTSKHTYELYSERFKAIKYFGNKNLIDLYGMGWEKSNDILINNVYRGTIKNKLETYSKYKFSICYENSYGEPGYVTEKLFDSISAGCVPIYFGPKNIRQYIPYKCFIDFRAFDNSYIKLENYLMQMDAKEYSKYQSNIDKFMQSKFYNKFTEKQFAITLEESFIEVNNRDDNITKKINMNKLSSIIISKKINTKDKLRLLANYFKSFIN